MARRRGHRPSYSNRRKRNLYYSRERWLSRIRDFLKKGGGSRHFLEFDKGGGSPTFQDKKRMQGALSEGRAPRGVGIMCLRGNVFPFARHKEYQGKAPYLFGEKKLDTEVVCYQHSKEGKKRQ